MPSIRQTAFTSAALFAVALSASAQGASQLPAASSAPPPATDEPRGLAVTGGVSEQEFFRNWEAARSRVRHELVSWGTDKADIIRTLAPSGLSVCVPAGKAVELCRPRVLEWYADFGPNPPARSRADASLFFFEGKFFQYSLSFGAQLFDFVRDTVMASLKAPTEKKSSTVQNRMGATFNQDEEVWRTEHTLVTVRRRSPQNLEEGEMVVIYLPIAMKVPKQDPGKPPF
jgi:hypothetical protein